MASPRVLLTGGTGLLALNWACAMRGAWDVVLGTHRHRVELKGVSSCPLNLEDLDALTAQFKGIAPDLIVHTASLTNVDRCEEDPQLALLANSEIAATTAAAARSRGIRLVHISTDHLFAGDRRFYREDDPPQPLNAYGRTKLLAEQEVLRLHPESIAVRTNFFGWGYAGRQSLSDWIIYNLRAGTALSLFDDVYFTPILADTLAAAVHELAGGTASGVYNLIGHERLSKYQFALRLARHFDLPRSLICRDRLAHANLRAPRPRDMSLDNSRASAVLKTDLGRVDEYLSALRLQEERGRREELFRAVTQ